MESRYPDSRNAEPEQPLLRGRVAKPEGFPVAHMTPCEFDNRIRSQSAAWARSPGVRRCRK